MSNISTQISFHARQEQEQEHHQQQQQSVGNGSIQQEVQNRSAPYRHSNTLRYMECLKNHAAAIGGHATDGCGEFLGGGEEGTIEALICCACNCHRNFHRKVIFKPCSNTFCCPPPQFTTPAPIVQIPADREGGLVTVKKRFRTKFTPEQKEKMYCFAEKSGWKIQEHSDAEVKKFCEEIGIRRKVLKVWIHNNKYHSNKQQ